MKALTHQQQKILRFVERFLSEHGFAPALREIGKAIGLKNVNAVRGHLEALEKKGYIAKDPDIARSIRVVQSGCPSPVSRLKRRLHQALRTDEGVMHRVVYALAWATWHKEPLLTASMQRQMSAALDREALEHGWKLIEKKITATYVSAVVEVWPNHSPEQTIRRFRNAGLVLKKNFPQQFPGKVWERGYIVTTDLELFPELIEQMLEENIETATFE
jgi:SOS-response transcriptional repressor LexA